MESDAGALFEFFLLQPTGLFRQQLAELEICFTQPIHLGGLDPIAKTFQDLGTPFVTLRFVLTHVLRQERSVLGLVVLRPRRLVLPSFGRCTMIVDSLRK